MRGGAYIRQRQWLWALRHGVELVDAQGDDGESYVRNLEDNLFCPLGDDELAEFRQGDGGELGNAEKPGKMQALHSSSAIGCNFFQYWRSIGAASSIAAACDLPKPALATSIEFEAKRPVANESLKGDFPKAPNLDVVIGYGPKSPINEAAVECKFSEAYGSKHEGLRPAYLEHEALWKGLPELHELARSISPDDQRF